MLGSRVNSLSRYPRTYCLLAAILFALTIAVRTGAQSPQSPQSPILVQEFDLPAYEAELNRCALEVGNLDLVPQLRRSLPRIWFVRTPNGRMDVSTTWLVQRLEKIEKDPANSKPIVMELTARLAAMRDAAKEMEGESQEPSVDSARDRLNKILQRSEFAGERGPSQWERAWERIGEWISERLARLMSALHLGAKTGNIVAWAVVGLAFLMLAYFVYRNLAGRQHALEPSEETAPDLTDSRQWARDALAAAERGDYREAVHCAYWASIVRLESLGLLKRDRARTPRESLRLLEPHATEHRSLREFTRHFELIWYGYRPASAEDWSAARAHLEKLGCLTASTAATVTF